MPDETPENAETPETPESAEKAPSNVERASLLSRPTDYVERPGFRNPSNKRTKAQKKGAKSR